MTRFSPAFPLLASAAKLKLEGIMQALLGIVPVTPFLILVGLGIPLDREFVDGVAITPFLIPVGLCLPLDREFVDGVSVTPFLILVGL